MERIPQLGSNEQLVARHRARLQEVTDFSFVIIYVKERKQAYAQSMWRYPTSKAAFSTSLITPGSDLKVPSPKHGISAPVRNLIVFGSIQARTTGNGHLDT